MEEQGLGASMAQQTGVRQDGSNPQQELMQVVQMLQQGATPDQLVQAGVPKELIDQAIRMLQQQAQEQSPNQAMQQQQMQGQPQGQGLADSMMAQQR